MWQSDEVVARVKPVAISFSLFFIFIAQTLFATGISSSSGWMRISGLKIGQKYSLERVLGYSFRVKYTGRNIVDLVIKLHKPKKTTADGIEPIPALSWLRIVKNRFCVGPDEEVYTDILITIPDNKEYLGKKYRVMLNPCIAPASGDYSPKLTGLAFGVGVNCVLELEIDSNIPTKKEIRNLKKDKIGFVLDADVVPERIFLDNVPLGKKINLKKDYNQTIKIINNTTEKISAQISCLSECFVPEGCQLPPKKSYVKSKKLRIKKNSVKEAPLYLFIPENKKNSNKKFYFVLQVKLSTKFCSINRYISIYVRTLTLPSP